MQVTSSTWTIVQPHIPGPHKQDTNDSVSTPLGSSDLKRKPSFKKHKNDKGKVFYENAETGETTWSIPEGAIVMEGREARVSIALANAAAGWKPTHRVHKSGDGKEFYEDLASGATTWNLPEGAVAIDAKEETAAKNEAARRRRSSFKGKRIMSKRESFRVSDMDIHGKALEAEL